MSIEQDIALLSESGVADPAIAKDALEALDAWRREKIMKNKRIVEMGLGLESSANTLRFLRDRHDALPIDHLPLPFTAKQSLKQLGLKTSADIMDVSAGNLKKLQGQRSEDMNRVFKLSTFMQKYSNRTPA